MKINEKTFLWIAIIFFLILTTVLFFRTCNDSDNTGTDAAITRSIQSITRTIRESIKIASYISGDYNELIRERDNYRNIAEQLRAGNRELEQRYNELQKNYNGLREYQSKNEQEIRNLKNACGELGNEIDEFGNEVDGLGRIIRAIQDGATEATD